MPSRQTSKFVPLPSEQTLLDIDTALTKRCAVSRRQRVSKLMCFAQTIKHCFDKGYSLQRTCQALEMAHQCKVHKTTLRSFALKNPLLRKRFNADQQDNA